MEFKKIKGKGKDNKTTYHLSMKIWSSTKTIDFNIDNVINQINDIIKIKTNKMLRA